MDGEVVGPPLEVRSLTGSSDGRVVLAGVHVGGISRSVDRGLTWHPTIDIDWDVHEVTHCSAVAFSGGDVLVSVSDGPFASHGTVFRRSIDAPGSLEPVGGGLPDRLEGIVDTGCIVSKGAELAVADRGGNVYASDDGGRGWTRRAEGIPEPSSGLIV